MLNIKTDSSHADKGAELNLFSFEKQNVNRLVKEAWDNIAPAWGLKNMVASNPLAAYEEGQFSDALVESDVFFKLASSPEIIEEINRYSVKWLQAYFDQGQALFQMPCKELGFYNSWKKLAIYDKKLHLGQSWKISFLKALPSDSKQCIEKLITDLNIKKKDQEDLLKFLLTSLSGWSSYIAYKKDWADNLEKSPIKEDFLAFRLVLIKMFDGHVNDISKYLASKKHFLDSSKQLQTIENNEYIFQKDLTEKIQKNISQKPPLEKAKAQLVFCIDVRSEPFRKSLEHQNHYETFGFAGFFGIPVEFEDQIIKKNVVSNPVLLKPKHAIKKGLASDFKKTYEFYNRISGEAKKIYRNLKYNVASPLILPEGIGIFSGLSIFFRSFFPRISSKTIEGVNKSLLKLNQRSLDLAALENKISFEDQCTYALGALKTIGLVNKFSPFVFLLGHGSKTSNNPYKNALDCGACGGSHGGDSAILMSHILNDKKVREFLTENGVTVPENTKFIAGEHNTTTDEIDLYTKDLELDELDAIEAIQLDFEKARELNNQTRILNFGKKNDLLFSKKEIVQRSEDWSQTRPEWGLAGNAAFIAGPRALTKQIDLGGRAFLHSYNWEIDKDNSILNTILSAPMVVAQWINSQYLFSTLDNVNFGGGSKVTQNIVGKFGVMQGNASDLMTGLPLQSVRRDDQTDYHTPQRLSAYYFAPKSKLLDAILANDKVKTLVECQWIFIFSVDPIEGKIYKLDHDLTWKLAEQNERRSA